MSDFKSIVDAAKRIETTLVEQFGAEGRGLHEKLSSVESRIPPNLQRTIRYLATVRNKAMHEDGYEIEDPADYLRRAAQVNAELLVLARPAAARAALAAGAGKTPFKPLVFVVAALLAGGAWYAADLLQARRDAAAERAEATVDEEDEAPSPAAADASEAAQAGDTVAALKAAVAAGRHAGLGNGALRVDGVQFAIRKGTWGELVPQITLKLTNTSDKTVASGRADAVLFLDGQDTPSVQAKDLFLYLGERGLAAGEARSVQIAVERDFAWGAPDVLNARRHVLAVRIASTDDGLHHAFGGSAPPLPWKAAANVPAEAHGEPQDVDMRSRIAAGASVGAGNAVVRLGTPSIRFGAGSFGRDVEISVEIENVSQRTVSWVKADALLFINGEAQPAVGDREAVSFYFGERGLAAGERRRVQGTLDSFKEHRWSAPDVLSAKSRLIALRVASTDDGMHHAFGGAARPFPWKVPE
ncbi:MAG: hypothetical protein QM702_04970 [Rubrivivax sp.]